MIRSSDIATTSAARTWQVFDGNGWQALSFLPIGAAHIFTHDASHGAPKTVLNFVAGHPRSHLFGMSFSLTYKRVARSWLLLGVTAHAQRLSFTTTASLAKPQWAPIAPVGGSDEPRYLQPGGISGVDPSWTARYPNLIDPSSPGHVFMYSAERPYLYFLFANASVFDRDVYRARLQVAPSAATAGDAQLRSR